MMKNTLRPIKLSFRLDGYILALFSDLSLRHIFLTLIFQAREWSRASATLRPSTTPLPEKSWLKKICPLLWFTKEGKNIPDRPLKDNL